MSLLVPESYKYGIWWSNNGSNYLSIYQDALDVLLGHSKEVMEEDRKSKEKTIVW